MIIGDAAIQLQFTGQIVAVQVERYQIRQIAHLGGNGPCQKQCDQKSEWQMSIC